ncbi:MAG: hypothetical protein ACRDM0_17280 [Thermoleophilaceae bacterium]
MNALVALSLVVALTAVGPAQPAAAQIPADAQLRIDLAQVMAATAR